MPIKIPERLPAGDILSQENISVILDSWADRQDVRPLKIAILNLMPTKEATETQLIRVLLVKPEIPIEGVICFYQAQSFPPNHPKLLPLLKRKRPLLLPPPFSLNKAFFRPHSQTSLDPCAKKWYTSTRKKGCGSTDVVRNVTRCWGDTPCKKQNWLRIKNCMA